jgi:hypothetical protein
MAALVHQVSVFSEAQLESTIGSYIAQGYAVANRTPRSVTMLKRKEFNVVWAIVGFFLCLIPLLIYAIVYSTQSDQMVEIRIIDAAALALPSPASVQTSADGRWWWDGAAWQDIEMSAPPNAQRSPDGRFWWDGERWRAMPGTIASAGGEPPSA